MAVELIFTMASRRFKIFGSGTFSTLTSCFPYQQFALMSVSLPGASCACRSGFQNWIGGACGCGELRPVRRLSSALGQESVVPDSAVGNHYFSNFHELFESSQRFLTQGARILA